MSRPTFALDTFTLTYTAGPGGSIVGTNPQTVESGADGTLVTATPNTGYHFVSWSDSYPTAARTDLNVTANVNATATFALDTFTLTYTAGPGGSIVGPNPQTVDYGTDGALVTATPNIGYHFVSWSDAYPTAARTDLNVTANLNVIATFAPDTFTLTTQVIGGGSLTLVPDQPAYDYGTSVQITANDHPGWQFDHWSVRDGRDNTLTVVVTSNLTIAAYFIDVAPPEVQVTSPNGGEEWACGSSQLITWTASDNDQVTGIDLAYSADGGATYPLTIATGLPNTGSYSWTLPGAPTLNARIRATAHDASGHSAFDASNAAFELYLTFTITATAGSGGSIAPSGPITVRAGSDETFVISAGTGYHIADVVVDGSSVGPVASYLFPNVQANHSIAATFAVDVLTISASAGPGGTIDPMGVIPVDYGSTQAFTITAQAGHHIVDVVVDGVSQGPVGSYSFTNITANHTITASFAIDTFTITATAGAGGSITPSGAVVVDWGSSQVFIIAPDLGRHVVDVVVDGVSQGPITSYTFASVTGNHTIAASFAIDTFTLTTVVVGEGSVVVEPNLPTYEYGTEVTVMATADSGWVFGYWEIPPIRGVDSLTVVMVSNLTVMAVFLDATLPEVQLTSPNGGEVCEATFTSNITWTASDNVAVTAVDLEYSTDSGATYPYVIATGLPNTGVYVWTVPSVGTMHARVRVRAHDGAGNTVEDTSDADFEIRYETSGIAENLMGADAVMRVYPNPAFKGRASVLYRMKAPGAAQINIYDVRGRLVRRLATGPHAQGLFSTKWDGADERGQAVAAGVYLVRLDASSGQHTTQRLVVYR